MIENKEQPEDVNVDVEISEENNEDVNVDVEISEEKKRELMINELKSLKLTYNPKKNFDGKFRKKRNKKRGEVKKSRKANR